MEHNEIIAYQAGFPVLLKNTEIMLVKPSVKQRFFLPSNVLVSRYGIVAMLIVDRSPEGRHVSYDNGDWTGVRDSGEMYEHEADLVRRAHFIDTKEGFSIARVFVLPQEVCNVFEGDQFLGEPMIEKCALEKVFDTEFDEMKVSLGVSRVISEASPLIKAASSAAWEASNIRNIDAEMHSLRTWISFHGWFAFGPAVAEAQESLVRALGNFDSFLGRFAPKMKYCGATHNLDEGQRTLEA